MRRIRSRRLRLIIGFALVVIAGLWATLMVALYMVQSQYLTVHAQVYSKSCHHVNSGGGYELADSKVCDLSISYVAPDGLVFSTVLRGVDENRLRRAPAGNVTVPIYFADRRSETPINPQNFVPLWAIIVLGVFGAGAPGLWAAFWLRAGLRRDRRPTTLRMTVENPPGTVTICQGQGLFLRADDTGLSVRNFYFGRSSRMRIAWSEISHFADGEYTKEGQTTWMLLIVLRTGKQVRVLSSVVGPPPGKVVAAIRKVAQPHGIPADLSGVPANWPGSSRNFLR